MDRSATVAQVRLRAAWMAHSFAKPVNAAVGAARRTFVTAVWRQGCEGHRASEEREAHRAVYDRLAASFAMSAFALSIVGPLIMADPHDGPAGGDGNSVGNAERSSGVPAAQHDGSWVIAGYTGSPYTHASDITFKRAAAATPATADPDLTGATDLTVEGVDWIGRPFKAPIYYGVRVQNWSSTSAFGGMLDFTHSKAIAPRDQVTQFRGQWNGRDLTGMRRIDDVFRKLEFSHGHNTLTLNGLVRLWGSGRVRPYLGVGGGVSLPHTEIHFKGAPKRTYEYQYTGPAFQALGGIELPVGGRLSLFIEYKLTVAPYAAPLHRRNGTILAEDVWRQWLDWWRGVAPPGGWATTRLVSHQIAGGLGVRIAKGSPTR
ncbi:MAG: hypothetical protein AAFR04_07720 [Pseudomonadota bacterium]